PNLSPRALIGTFSGTTGPIGLVLTSPSLICIKISQIRFILKLLSEYIFVFLYISFIVYKP
ncbi:MAG: hypothetical protein K1564_20155, partial [Candidatus Thiodiazotropha sp. (ex. Lucinisca nassula)]|nr:hypothetical protein [Candidatus Thiodiazotropha sp. (ex. Lucinisca nassula)]